MDMAMMEDQHALQIVLEKLSYNPNQNSVLYSAGPDIRTLRNIPNATTGTFYNVTEKNSAYKDSALAKFDMKKPAPISVPNVTEHVTVPSSEHVAEIVGRQGCKIKALRNKTNTYIKTPGRGEEPLFIITGQREDVMTAVREIEQASAHFTNIRAQRNSNKSLTPPAQEGQITDKVQVPYRVVGLVVGPKGQTIKQIQNKTATYIVTPSRERDPIFEITGMPENVAKAREEIMSYISIRTGLQLEENAVGHFTFNGAGNVAGGGASSAMTGKTLATGVWNPTKNDSDEFDSMADVFSNTMNTIYSGSSVSTVTNEQREFGRNLIDYSLLSTNAHNNKENDENMFHSSTRSMHSRLFSESTIENVNDLVRSPMQNLNINTTGCFNTWDNRSLIPQAKQAVGTASTHAASGIPSRVSPKDRNNTARDPLEPFKFGSDFMSELGCYTSNLAASGGSNGLDSAMNEVSKISPLSSSNASQHSCSGASAGSTDGDQQSVPQFGLFGTQSLFSGVSNSRGSPDSLHLDPWVCETPSGNMTSPQNDFTGLGFASAIGQNAFYSHVEHDMKIWK